MSLEEESVINAKTIIMEIRKRGIVNRVIVIRRDHSHFNVTKKLENVFVWMVSLHITLFVCSLYKKNPSIIRYTHNYNILAFYISGTDRCQKVTRCDIPNLAFNLMI